MPNSLYIRVAHVGMDSNQDRLVVIGQESEEAAVLGELPFYPMLEDNQTSRTNEVIRSSASGIMSDSMDSANLPAKAEAEGTTIATTGAPLPVLDAPMLQLTLPNISVTQADGATVVMLNYVLETDPERVHSTDPVNQKESDALVDGQTAPWQVNSRKQRESHTPADSLENQTVPYAADIENQRESALPTGCRESPTAPHSGIPENQGESRTVTNGLENWTVPHSTDTEKRDLHLLIGHLENQISPHTANQETHPLSGCQP